MLFRENALFCTVFVNNLVLVMLVCVAIVNIMVV